MTVFLQERLVCLVFPESPDPRERMDAPECLVCLEQRVTMDSLVDLDVTDSPEYLEPREIVDSTDCLETRYSVSPTQSNSI